MKLIECPRDAMQGIKEFIPTDLKARYINHLLKVGFDTIDIGSFVSPKAVPQMQDSEEVYQSLEIGQSKSKLLAIVANVRGAERAIVLDKIDYVGFPLSLSETFQQRNTNKSIEDAFNTIQEILRISKAAGQELVVYLSMGFGNPYGDPYSPEYIKEFVDRLNDMGVNIISLSDTIGSATPESIQLAFEPLLKRFPHIEFGAHIHSTPDLAGDKVHAVYDCGVRRIDGALLGYGGCPMAKDTLTGNMDTETIIRELSNKIQLGLNMEAFAEAKQIANEVFN